MVVIPLNASRVAMLLALGGATPLLAGCGGPNALAARQARADLVGATELDLQTCLGLPDQRLTKGKTTLLTYFTNSQRAENIGFAGLGLSYSGYCHATFRLEDGRVTKVRYSGDTTLFGAKDGVCGPIVRACLDDPEPSIARRSSVEPGAPVASTQ